MRPVSRGDRGKGVVDIQTRLRALGFNIGREGADGHFGPETEKAARSFQQRRLLLADGVVGENTWTELVEAGYVVGERLLYLRIPYMRGDDVLFLQRQLNQLGFDSGPENGIFDSRTETALTEFQLNAGVNVDGIMGEATLHRLRRISKTELTGLGRKIPDRNEGYVGRDRLAGLRVSIDPGHGGRDPGARGSGGVLEKQANLLLALRLAEMLRAGGAQIFLTRESDRTLSLYERAERVNQWGSELHLCLHYNRLATRQASGSATYFFANGSYFSEAGKRLAGYVVKSLVDRLGRHDLHTHGRSFVCLREVQALAVMIEPGFITHPEEGQEIATPEGQEAEAGAIMAGLEAYLQRS
jgi:N-acetylmuramoyl-L-alanine amidase